jgi:hypothetical protein
MVPLSMPMVKPKYPSASPPPNATSLARCAHAPSPSPTKTCAEPLSISSSPSHLAPTTAVSPCIATLFPNRSSRRAARRDGAPPATFHESPAPRGRTRAPSPAPFPKTGPVVPLHRHPSPSIFRAERPRPDEYVRPTTRSTGSGLAVRACIATSYPKRIPAAPSRRPDPGPGASRSTPRPRRRPRRTASPSSLA